MLQGNNDLCSGCTALTRGWQVMAQKREEPRRETISPNLYALYS